MKKMMFLLCILIVGILSACSGDKEQPKVPELLEVVLNLPDEELDAGAEVVLEAVVTQGKEKVEDASEVKFEVLRQGSSDSEMLEAEHQGEGVYTAKKQFADEGTYAITAHVTARDMHNMPKKNLMIGSPETSGHQDEAESDHAEGESHEEEAGHSHGHENGLIVELFPGYEFKANEEVELSASIMEEGKPLTDAKISFEIYQEGKEKHDFIEASEEGEGVYKIDRTFKEPGNYQINVHMNKGDLHEHQLFTVMVE